MTTRDENRIYTEIPEFITLEVPELPEHLFTELINVESGFLNVRTRQLFPHSPELLSTIRSLLHMTNKPPAPRLKGLLARSSPGRRWTGLGDSGAIY